MLDKKKTPGLTPLQIRILKYIYAARGASFKDVLRAFEPLGIKCTDTGRALIDLLNNGLISFENELLPNANLVL